MKNVFLTPNLTFQAMTCKQHPYASAAQGYPAAYDNYGMAYPAGATGSVPGYYAGPGGTFHMWRKSQAC